MLQNKFLNFIKRIFLYQHLIYFSLTKFDNNLLNSQKEFIHKSKILFIDLGFSNFFNVSLPENDDILYRIFLIYIITISLLSILNFTFMQFISGISSIYIGFVYHNPFLQYNELIVRNINLNFINVYCYLPSFELITFIGCGFAMIGQSLRNVDLCYYLFCCCFYGDCEENDKNKKKKRTCRINLQLEFDVNSNRSNNSSFDKSY